MASAPRRSPRCARQAPSRPADPLH
ncbi:hypothetical protein R2601_04008 [Salipiger bermudensis HTCC2601]|uniref:Uncharacterized protein n=1 Tax=Salipiger bermudensis (strain DSM 26914 / JCM 13377 / KCTC 12554 / HTCC2601) TaxID=314265 RepID=Q0FW44_SALBH|nr:hypothetical protein R2601_04008 [Salipiger bermudensis HTCC2601]